MDGATIQARVNSGYAKAAQRTGLSYSLHRPTVPTDDPLAATLLTLPATISPSSSFNFRSPGGFSDDEWFALLDKNLAQAGDYLAGNGQTFFIGAMQFLVPAIVVECNRLVRIVRQASSTTVGAVPYGGATAATEAPVLGAVGALWPASVLIGGGRGRSGELPASAAQVAWGIKLPASAPTINTGDVAIDDLGRRYQIQGAELTDNGWRITASEVHA